MARDPNLIAEDWAKNPNRPVYIIDEVREADAGEGEYVIFCCIETTAGHAINLLKAAAKARKTLAKPAQKKAFKGKSLFGNRAKKANANMGQYVFGALKTIDGLMLLISSSSEISKKFANTKGSITLVPDDAVSSGGQMRGRELMPVLTFIKNVAVARKLGDIQVDVIIDRSTHLGMDPTQRKIQSNQFEVMGPQTLNDGSDGKPAPLQCPSSFRIIAAADEGTFMDLLLLPDAIAYLGFKGGSFNGAKDRVKKGDAFYMWAADLSYFKKAEPAKGAAGTKKK